MTLQFLQDTKGNTTGVFIPIEEWQDMKEKYVDLEKEEFQNITDLTSWQKEIIDQRLADYFENQSDVDAFSATLNKLRSEK